MTKPVTNPATPDTDADTPPKDSFGEVIGAAFWLAARSRDHRDMPFGAVADAILAGIDSRQFRLWRKDGAPLAFVSWGLLDEAAEQQFRAGGRLDRDALSSGDRAWVVAVISPFLPGEVVLKDLRETQFKGQSLMALV
ncbi:MAG: toxin-activating lysine-acyltransferase [Marinibacterium sp.]|nr:toxin-activating lysine-acyltransferase [Marinibacterium sp.]